MPGSGMFPGERNGNPLQCSCLENSIDRGAWRAIAHGVTKCWIWLDTYMAWQIFTEYSNVYISHSSIKIFLIYFMFTFMHNKQYPFKVHDSLYTLMNPPAKSRYNISLQQKIPMPFFLLSLDQGNHWFASCHYSISSVQFSSAAMLFKHSPVKHI